MSDDDDHLPSMAIEACKEVIDPPAKSEAEIRQDINIWFQIIDQYKNSDRGVARADTVEHLQNIEAMAQQLRELIQPEKVRSQAKEAHAWILGAAINSGSGINKATEALDRILSDLDELVQLSSLAAGSAKLSRGQKAGDIWNSPNARQEALGLLMSMWRDWTGKKRFGAPFPSVAEQFLGTAFFPDNSEDGVPDFDRTLAKARKAYKGRPDNYRVFWRDTEWGMK